jgi:hypothetical protein
MRRTDTKGVLAPANVIKKKQSSLPARDSELLRRLMTFATLTPGQLVVMDAAVYGCPKRSPAFESRFSGQAVYRVVETSVVDVVLCKMVCPSKTESRGNETTFVAGIIDGEKLAETLSPRLTITRGTFATYFISACEIGTEYRHTLTLASD